MAGGGGGSGHSSIPLLYKVGPPSVYGMKSEWLFHDRGKLNNATVVVVVVVVVCFLFCFVCFLVFFLFFFYGSCFVFCISVTILSGRLLFVIFIG